MNERSSAVVVSECAKQKQRRRFLRSSKEEVERCNEPPRGK